MAVGDEKFASPCGHGPFCGACRRRIEEAGLEHSKWSSELTSLGGWARLAALCNLPGARGGSKTLALIFWENRQRRFMPRPCFSFLAPEASTRVQAPSGCSSKRGLGQRPYSRSGKASGEGGLREVRLDRPKDATMFLLACQLLNILAREGREVSALHSPKPCYPRCTCTARDMSWPGPPSRPFGPRLPPEMQPKAPPTFPPREESLELSRLWISELNL